MSTGIEFQVKIASDEGTYFMKKGCDSVPRIIAGTTGWSSALRGGIHEPRYQGVEAGVAPLVIIPKDYWETGSQTLISSCSEFNILVPKRVYSYRRTTRVLLNWKLWLWRSGHSGLPVAETSGQTSHHPIRNPWLWWAGGGGAAVAYTASRGKVCGAQVTRYGSSYTPSADCDSDGQHSNLAWAAHGYRGFRLLRNHKVDHWEPQGWQNRRWDRGMMGSSQGLKPTAGPSCTPLTSPFWGSPRGGKSTRALDALALIMDGELHLHTAWDALWSVQTC